MRLSWNEIRVRAKNFSDEWKDAHYEKGETQSFYNDFFEVFGVKRRQVGRYEEAVKDLKGNSQFIDLFWPGMLIVEQKSAGRDLGKAESQAFRYFDILKKSQQPRYIMVCDFQHFQLRDLAERDVLEFDLKDLHKHVQKFGFMIGVERREFKDQDPVNIKAAELVGQLHDALEEAGTTGRDLEVFLVQIVFCLFADDTGVFQPKDIFLQFLEGRTKEDGSDLGPLLSQIFQTLDTPEDKRSKHLDEDINQFPYVNGRLFERHTRIPAFDSAMRDKLIEASRFDWSPISPAIFGALFQSVMDKVERRKKGAHYTTEKNILKVIGPLFMDGLEAEFEKAKALKRGRRAALEALQDKLSKLTFFDPACGCGNFLIIAYRELRRLEIDILKAKLGKGQLELDANVLSKIDVDQFFGIELEEFPARIAETAMWMMDHIMNNELSLAFGQNYARIPLDKAANIRHSDALDIDWQDVLPAKNCNYVFGNPPFIGQSYQSKEQRIQMARIIDAANKKAGSLDYVGAWFIKAGAYINKGGTNPAHIAFVATNSITQGEMVAQLWPILFQRFHLEISFAHRTFEWGSDAKGKAHVHCVIIGLSHEVNQPETKRLFSYDNVKGEPEESQMKFISPYLFSAGGLKDRHTSIADMSKPISPRPRMMRGVQSTDGGHYIFRGDEYDDFLSLEPNAKTILNPYIGAAEYIKGKKRWILDFRGVSPSSIKSMPEVQKRIQAVRDFRSKSRKPATQKLANFPTELEGKTYPESPFLVIPQVSSERRPYVPFGWLEPPTIPSDKLRYIQNVELHMFSILTSAIHMGWMRTVSGRLESRYMYSVGVVYNTFPWPDLNDKAKAVLTKTGQAILDARAAWSEATLADLYDPDTMPANLRKAHIANDKAVDKLYRKKPFESERERVEHLFMLYEKLQSPILAAAKPKPRKRKARTVKTS